jgi:glyoxylase-like metal-dependent hydrolase (beta-lactamase superfamily II)
MKKSNEALIIYILNVTLILSICSPEFIYAQDSEIKPPIASKVKDGIYVHKSGNTNITISSGDDGLLIVDTGVTNRAAKSDSLIRSGFKKPIKYILNTHYHFDHVQGNNVFARDGAVIISSEKTRENMLKEWKAPEIPDVNFPIIPPFSKEFLPEICFNDSIKLYFNNEVIKLIHLPGGHSDGDVIVFFTKSNVIHMGDLFLTEAFPPVTDIEIYVKVLENIIKTCDEKTIVISGHGNISDKKGLISYKELISTAAKRVLNLKSEGKSFEEILAAKPITDLLENSWIPESLFIYCIYYKPKF